MRPVHSVHFVALALATLVVACSDHSMPTQPDLTSASSLGQPAHAVAGADMGFTDGWFNGTTVKFFYHKPFFCGAPVADGGPIGSTSGCEVGSDGPDPRPGKVPELYVMTPLGFRPDASTLHCPIVGQCINHPSTVDLSRLFGAGAANAPLPAHSHIVEQDGGNSWSLLVIGVKDLATWNQIVAAKSLDKVRELQAADPGGTRITADIPSNIYLTFAVQPGKP
jgi:hypothetical protein